MEDITLDVEHRIIEFVRLEFLEDATALGVHDDLLADDMLDSLGVLQLAAFVDEEFQIGMQPEDFVIENFQTVSALAAYVRATLASQAEPQAASG